MALLIDSNGVTIETFGEIFTRLQDAYKEIYGSDINIDQDTPDGQKLGILAKEILDGQEYGVSLYNSFDPDLAAGLQLNKILKLSGLIRRPATKSTVSINVTTSQSVTLPANYTVSDDIGQKWIVKASTALTAGVTAVDFEAENYGAIEADAGTITTPVSIILGVTSITNPAAASPGVDEETDVEIRRRRSLSVENPAYSTIGSLYADLFQINGVTDALIYENDTDVLDAVRNIEAHTIWVVIEGGANGDITEAIAKSKTAGTGLKGSTTGTYTETITKPNGTLRSFTHTAKFDRPTVTDIYIKFDVTPKVPGDTIDHDAIKNALAALSYAINESITVTELYGAIYSGGTNFIASSLQISDDDATYVSDILSPGYAEKYSIITAQITITVI